jgi:hypothetical protein
MGLRSLKHALDNSPARNLFQREARSIHLKNNQAPTEPPLTSYGTANFVYAACLPSRATSRWIRPL